jgi:L-ascorbate metabolism protein UlaG (beta-lactamase superfamily)
LRIRISKKRFAMKTRIKGRIMMITGIITMAVIGLVIGFSCSTTGIKKSGARYQAMMNSPQWKDGKFRNPLKQYNSSPGKMLRQWIESKTEYRVPVTPIPVDKRRNQDYHTPPASGLRITWLGHSSVLIEVDGQRVLTDPVWSKRVSPVSFIGPERFYPPPLPLNELPGVDAVVISHDHYDHLDKETIVALKDKVPLFAVPLGVGAYLEQWGVDPEKIVERDWWGEVKTGNLTLTATPARHFSGRSMVRSDLDQTLWCGWSIAGPEHRVYYSGDTAMFPGFAEIGRRLGPFHMTLIELGAYNSLWPDVHIGPEQAVRAHILLRGRLMMPVHWGTFNLAMHNWTEPVERLMAAREKEGISLVIPRPGEIFETTTPPKLVRWWPKRPWQSAGEAPIISTGNDPLPSPLPYKSVKKPAKTSNITPVN